MTLRFEDPCLVETVSKVGMKGCWISKVMNVVCSKYAQQVNAERGLIVYGLVVFLRGFEFISVFNLRTRYTLSIVNHWNHLKRVHQCTFVIIFGLGISGENKALCMEDISIFRTFEIQERAKSNK